MRPEEVMAMLVSAKKPKTAVRTKPKKPRIKRVITRKLGHMIGYCPKCGIFIAEIEVEAPCTRCKEQLHACAIPTNIGRKKEWMGPMQPWGDPRVPATYEFSAAAIKLSRLDMAILRHGNRTIL